MNAVLLTFSTAASLLFALKTRIIQVTDRFADTVSALSHINLVTTAQHAAAAAAALLVMWDQIRCGHVGQGCSSRAVAQHLANSFCFCTAVQLPVSTYWWHFRWIWPSLTIMHQK
jgi:hypothetical protein